MGAIRPACQNIQYFQCLNFSCGFLRGIAHGGILEPVAPYVKPICVKILSNPTNYLPTKQNLPNAIEIDCQREQLRKVLYESALRDMRRSRIDQNREFYVAAGRLIADRRGATMTQESLAKRVQLTRTSINNIERGRQQILLHTLVDIATALNCTPADLIPQIEKGNLELLLRDKPKKGADWIKSITTAKG